jgi:Tfp pilus assembly protein PilZ
VADNRRQTRHLIALPVTLTVAGTPNNCTMLNVSLGGAQLAVSTRYPMGTRVQLVFTVPTMNEPIDVGGTVRWSSVEGLGIQFDGLRARDVWALNEFFKQLPS